MREHSGVALGGSACRVEQDGLPAGLARGRGFEQIDGVGGQAHFVGSFFCGQVDQLHQIGLGDAPVGTVPVGMAVDQFEDPTADRKGSAPEGGRDGPGPALEEGFGGEVGLGGQERESVLIQPGTEIRRLLA